LSVISHAPAIAPRAEQVAVQYCAVSLFDENGKLTLPILREVQNKNCLFCHRESDWKKAGASFQARAGVRCIDCHVSARKSSDSRISGRDIHNFGKGDNPERSTLGFNCPDISRKHNMGNSLADIPALNDFSALMLGRN